MSQQRLEMLRQEGLRIDTGRLMPSAPKPERSEPVEPEAFGGDGATVLLFTVVAFALGMALGAFLHSLS
jgi:hypothetical protein